MAHRWGFDYNAPADLFLARNRKRGGVRYRRFETAAEAIRFAEELPPPLLLTIVGLPLGLWIINRLPTVITLRPQDQQWRLDDGGVLNAAPLWELMPWKVAKDYWEELLQGKYEWSSIGKQLRAKGLVR